MKIRWIFRNDRPAKTSVSHAYIGRENKSLCGMQDREAFDWTEMDGRKCKLCQREALWQATLSRACKAIGMDE